VETCDGAEGVGISDIPTSRGGQGFQILRYIRRSARSAPANISEGFWRGKQRPRENAKFVSYALGSLGETKNHLRDAFVEKYIGNEEHAGIVALNVRALQVTEGWYDYLMSLPPSHAADGPNAKPRE
jgi:four helix bundle protein